MAGGVGGYVGGIAGLLGVLREHGEAVEYDLLRCGLRLDQLGTERLSWRDVLVLVRRAQPDSAVFKALNPHWQRTLEVQFLQSMELSLRRLFWAKTEDGQRGRDAPEPMWLPWDEQPVEVAIVGDSMSPAEARHWLGWETQMLDD